MSENKHSRIIGSCPPGIAAHEPGPCSHVAIQYERVIIVPKDYDIAALNEAIADANWDPSKILITTEIPEMEFSGDLYMQRFKELAEEIKQDIAKEIEATPSYRETIDYPKDNRPWYVRATSSAGGFKNKRNRKFRY